MYCKVKGTRGIGRNCSFQESSVLKLTRSRLRIRAHTVQIVYRYKLSSKYCSKFYYQEEGGCLFPVYFLEHFEFRLCANGRIGRKGSCSHLTPDPPPPPTLKPPNKSQSRRAKNLPSNILVLGHPNNPNQHKCKLAIK